MGTCGEATCCRQGSVMSFILTLHDRRNLIYYPLTCCHRTCSFKYLFNRSFAQDGLSIKSVLGPEVKVGTVSDGNPILSTGNPSWKRLSSLEERVFRTR